MVDAHAAALMQSLKLNQGIPELPVDDAKLHAFMRPPRTPSPPDTRSPSFAPRHSGLRPTSSPHQRASPLTGRPIAGIGNRIIDQQGHMGTDMDAMRQAWQDDMAELQLHDRMGLEGAPWVADFADRPRLQGHGHQAMPAESAWAAEFGGRLQLGQQSPSQVIPAFHHGQHEPICNRMASDSRMSSSSCWIDAACFDVQLPACTNSAGQTLKVQNICNCHLQILCPSACVSSVAFAAWTTLSSCFMRPRTSSSCVLLAHFQSAKSHSGLGVARSHACLYQKK